MSELYRMLRNRRPPMVVRINRKRHVTGPMAQPQAPQIQAPPAGEENQA